MHRHQQASFNTSLSNLSTLSNSSMSAFETASNSGCGRLAFVPSSAPLCRSASTSQVYLQHLHSAFTMGRRQQQQHHPSQQASHHSSQQAAPLPPPLSPANSCSTAEGGGVGDDLYSPHFTRRRLPKATLNQEFIDGSSMSLSRMCTSGAGRRGSVAPREVRTESHKQSSHYIIWGRQFNKVSV